MESVAEIIGFSFGTGLTIAGFVYIAFALIMAIGAWAALRD
jgi:hypothetical protein